MSSLEEDLLTKAQLKYNPTLERQARRWIEDVLHEPLPTSATLAAALKTGVILCRVVNTIKPNIVPKINERNQPYSHRVRCRATPLPPPLACRS